MPQPIPNIIRGVVEGDPAPLPVEVSFDLVSVTPTSPNLTAEVGDHVTVFATAAVARITVREARPFEQDGPVRSVTLRPVTVAVVNTSRPAAERPAPEPVAASPRRGMLATGQRWAANLGWACVGAWLAASAAVGSVVLFDELAVAVTR